MLRTPTATPFKTRTHTFRKTELIVKRGHVSHRCHLDLLQCCDMPGSGYGCATSMPPRHCMASRWHFQCIPSTSIGTCSTLLVYLPGHPCRRCFGQSQQRVLYQWATWLRPLSRGKQGGIQLNTRCSSPLQPEAFGLLQTATVTDCSRSLRVSIMALVRDHVNMMWRICKSGENISVSTQEEEEVLHHDQAATLTDGRNEGCSGRTRVQQERRRRRIQVLW
jgi:hypothetical protein